MNGFALLCLADSAFGDKSPCRNPSTALRSAPFFCRTAGHWHRQSGIITLKNSAAGAVLHISCHNNRNFHTFIDCVGEIFDCVNELNKGNGKLRTGNLHKKRNIIIAIICSIVLLAGIITTIVLLTRDKFEIYPDTVVEYNNHDNMQVIDDAYNSNETGFKKALDSLRYFNSYKILITPGVIELGKENQEVNYRLGLYIVDKVDEVILIGENSLSIKKALNEIKYINYKYFNTYKEGYSYLKTINKDFIVLIENDLLDYYLK